MATHTRVTKALSELIYGVLVFLTDLVARRSTPIHGNAQIQFGWTSEKCGLMESVPNHGRDIETGWLLVSLPTPTIPWLFFQTKTFFYFYFKCWVITKNCLKAVPVNLNQTSEPPYACYKQQTGELWPFHCDFQFSAYSKTLWCSQVMPHYKWRK